MKKLIFAILLFLSVFVDSYSQQSIRIGAGNIYYIGSDSNYFRFNKQGFFSFGLKTIGTSYMYGRLEFPNADGILLTGGNVTLNDGGNINVNNGGGYFLDGVNITSLFPSLSGRNTWTKWNKFDTLGVGSSAYFTFGSSTVTLSGADFYSGIIGASDLTVTHELDVTGATITGLSFTATAFSTDTIRNYNTDKVIYRAGARFETGTGEFVSTGVGNVSFLSQSDNSSIELHRNDTLGNSSKVRLGGDSAIVTANKIVLNGNIYARSKYYNGLTSGNYALNVSDDTLFNFRSPLFADSSYNRLTFNAWTGSATWKLFGKAGTNLLTLDSVGMTTTLPITSTSSSTNTFSGGLKGVWVEGASGQYLGLTSRFLIASATDGKIKLLNYAGNGFTSLAFGLETSSFPMLKRSGDSLLLRLGDDTGYSDLTLGNLTATSINGRAFNFLDSGRAVNTDNYQIISGEKHFSSTAYFLVGNFGGIVLDNSSLTAPIGLDVNVDNSNLAFTTTNGNMIFNTSSSFQFTENGTDKFLTSAWGTRTGGKRTLTINGITVTFDTDD